MTLFKALALGMSVTLSGMSTSAAPITPDKAFEKMHALVGDWEARTEKGSVIHINYRLVSSNSILVQTFTTPSGRQTLTVFHMDGSALMATHYCAQGNQPRLLFESSSTDTSLAFLFFDATNLSDPQASHLRHLQVDLLDPDHFNETDTYTTEGKDEPEVLRYARVH